MKTNVKVATKDVTHEGGRASHINAEDQLRRSVMACLLWENSFYEDGVAIAERIKSLIPKVSPDKVAEMAIEAREQMKLRHIPLFLVREMARLPKHKALVADTLGKVIQRADELSEFLAIYWKDGREKVSAQVKKGLAKAFKKFDEYALAKYDRNNSAVRLRDVLFLCHAKPEDKAQEKLWKKLANNELTMPDTWEVQLSAGADKKSTWERLIDEKKLGAMAFLRNLRNMEQVGVDKKAIKKYFKDLDVSRVLPFRFITAARHAPQWEPELEAALFKSLEGRFKFKGHTVILVDVSGSMGGAISGRTEVSRVDAACGLAIVAREICESVSVYSFSESLAIIPARRGFALRDAINISQPHSGTYLGGALKAISAREKYDRIIVVTDEQSSDKVGNPDGKGYMLNVAAYQNGVGYGAWTHVTGWSDSVLEYVRATEK